MGSCRTDRRLVDTALMDQKGTRAVPAAHDRIDKKPPCTRRAWTGQPLVRLPLETMTRCRIDHTAIGAGGSIELCRPVGQIETRLISEVATVLSEADAAVPSRTVRRGLRGLRGGAGV